MENERYIPVADKPSALESKYYNLINQPNLEGDEQRSEK